MSFQARNGTIPGLLGPNGAGKTTTLRMLSGLMRPDAGLVEVDGTDVVSDPIAAQQYIGLLPDSRGLYARLTPLEHIRYFGELRGLHGGSLDEGTNRVIRRLGLEPIADRRVGGVLAGRAHQSGTGPRARP